MKNITEFITESDIELNEAKTRKPKKSDSIEQIVEWIKSLGVTDVLDGTNDVGLRLYYTPEKVGQLSCVFDNANGDSCVTVMKRYAKAKRLSQNAFDGVSRITLDIKGGCGYINFSQKSSFNDTVSAIEDLCKNNE